MLKEISEGLKQVSQAVFQENEKGTSEGRSYEDDLLIAVITLGTITFALILIIIYGYCKYVRKKPEAMEKEGRERSSNMRESTGDALRPPLSAQQEDLSEVTQLSVPVVKMRKRSMTFSETDEECRKYREDLADSFGKPETAEETDRSRKKSVVTFVGVEEIDSNGL